MSSSSSRQPLGVGVLAIGLVAAVVALVASPPATAGGRPGAPAPATATIVAGTSSDYRVTWSTAPANGAPIKRYVIKVKGQRRPVVAVGARTRSYRWTGPVAGRAPLTFVVRAVNRLGAGPRTGAVAGTLVTPTTTADPTPGTNPTPSTNPTPGTNPTPATHPTPGTDPTLPYSADAYFTSRADGAVVDATRTAEFHAFMSTAPDQKDITWPKLNMSDAWAMSYHVAGAGDPVWRLTGGNTDNSRLRVLTTQGFHMADAVANAFPAGDQDRAGVIIDPVFGYTVQFADAVPDLATRTISVSNAGIVWHSSNGLDYRNPLSDDPRNFTSRGRIPDAMVIRRDLLDQAIAHDTGLGHVLHLYFVETRTSDGFRSPMVGAESGKYGWGAEGERLRLKPSIDLVARGLTGAALAVARTLQQNGAYLGDNSGSATQIKASQASAYTGTNMATDMFEGKISWDDFEVLASH